MRCCACYQVGYQIGDAKPVYCLEGSVAIAGALIQWLRDNLGMIKEAPEVEALAQTVDDAGGIYMVPVRHSFTSFLPSFVRSFVRPCYPAPRTHCPAASCTLCILLHAPSGPAPSLAWLGLAWVCGGGLCGTSMIGVMRCTAIR